MSSKNCSSCVFYKQSSDGTCGCCEYPLPEWVSLSGCRFISSPDYTGADCPVFKSRIDIISREKQTDRLTKEGDT